MSVPKSLQPAFDGIEPLITDFCNQYLNDEYQRRKFFWKNRGIMI